MADVALRGGDAQRAATLLGAAEGVRGTGTVRIDDGARVTPRRGTLPQPRGTSSAAFQRGREVTLATLEAAGVLTPGA